MSNQSFIIKNFLSNINVKNIIIYGYGEIGQKLETFIREFRTDLDIICIIDNKLANTKFKHIDFIKTYVEFKQSDLLPKEEFIIINSILDKAIFDIVNKELASNDFYIYPYYFNDIEIESINYLKNLTNDLIHFKRIEAEITLLNKPFWIDPMRNKYQGIMGLSGLQKMLNFDMYGLQFIENDTPSILDIGSHIGIFPRVIKEKFPNATIYSIEPDRENFYFLQKNNNILKDVHNYQLGIYNKKDTLILRESNIHSWRSTFDINSDFFENLEKKGDDFSHNSYNVDVIDIDSFISENNIQTLDLIGITVPGKIGFEIIDGARETLKKLKPIISIVIYPDEDSKITKLLEELDYTFSRHSFSMMKTFIHNDNMKKIKNNFPKNLNNISQPKTLLSKGENDTWEESGVRDPAILMDEEGNPTTINGKMYMYYTGSQNECTIQSIGCATSEDNGKTWTKYISNPILRPDLNCDYGKYITSTPWAIKKKTGEIYLYYRSSNTQNGRKPWKDSISLAISNDGINFKKYENNPLLTWSKFQDIPIGSAMGVMNCVKLNSGEYLLTFEAESKKYKLSQIFGALSKDGINFTPINNGNPFFHCEHVTSYKVKRVCNPRVTVFNNGILLGYNALYGKRRYTIGFAFSKDLKNWEDYKYNPILVPSDICDNNSFSGRVEGPILLFNKEKNNLDKMIFMSIPRKSKSHMNAIIASCEFNNQTVNYPYYLKRDCLLRSNITLIDNHSFHIINNGEKSKDYISVNTHTSFKITLFKDSEVTLYFSSDFAISEEEASQHINSNDYFKNKNITVPIISRTEDKIIIHLSCNLLKILNIVLKTPHSMILINEL